MVRAWFNYHKYTSALLGVLSLKLESSIYLPNLFLVNLGSHPSE